MDNIISFFLGASLAFALTALFYEKGIKENGRATLINRRYIEVEFCDGTSLYHYFIPFSRIKSMYSAEIVGKKTEKRYNINAGALPSLSFKDLGEELFIVDDGEQKNEISAFDEITF